MSVHDRQIPITSPCPISLDRSGVGPAAQKMFCEHCTKDVHLLSQMSEGEARDLLRNRAGDDICVSYNVRKDGRIQFRPEPALVSPSSLVRSRPMRRGLSMAASVGAAAILSACTPHSEPEPSQQTEVVEPEIDVTIEEKIEEKIEDEPPVEEVVAGGITAEEIPPVEPCDSDLTQVDGGIRAEPLAKPAEVGRERPVHVRGGVRARPVADPFPGVDDQDPL